MFEKIEWVIILLCYFLLFFTVSFFLVLITITRGLFFIVFFRLFFIVIFFYCAVAQSIMAIVIRCKASYNITLWRRFFETIYFVVKLLIWFDKINEKYLLSCRGHWSLEPVETPVSQENCHFQNNPVKWNEQINPSKDEVFFSFQDIRVRIKISNRKILEWIIFRIWKLTNVQM